MNSNYLDLLPDEMLLKLLSETDDLKTLSKWCQTSKRVNRICQDDGFWHNKYRKDFGLSSELTLTEGETWREEYKRRKLNINSPISAGSDHYGVIDQKGNLYMAGKNKLGQLGVGKYVEKSYIPTLVKFPGKSQKVISISMGDEISGAVTNDGKVYIWGDNDSGLLPSNQKIIWTPEELILTKKATKIVIDYSGYIVLFEDSSIYFYSSRDDSPKGYLKLKVIDIFYNPEGPFSVITKDYKFYIWGNLEHYGIIGDILGGMIGVTNRFIKTPLHIELPEPVIKISQQDFNPMILSITGKIYILDWMKPNGSAGKPKPILINLPEKIVHISDHSNALAAVSDTGRLYMWGHNRCKKIVDSHVETFPRPIEISIGFPINFVSIGGSFTIAISNDNVINYWGNTELKPV